MVVDSGATMSIAVQHIKLPGLVKVFGVTVHPIMISYLGFKPSQETLVCQVASWAQAEGMEGRAWRALMAEGIEH